MAVAIFISTYLNSNTGDAWPSLARLAKDTNRAPSTVSRAVRRLESLGLIIIDHARGRENSNHYRPALGDTANPEDLKRRTTARGKILRTRTPNTANSHTKTANSQQEP
jgi:DNA-binding transcriptional regulator YhcF (GntR family)